jgi:hypothetical protein
MVHLLPILARAVFQDLSQAESNKTSFLRLPAVSSNFVVFGSSGVFDHLFYEPVEKNHLSDIIAEWAKYKDPVLKPLTKESDVSVLTSICICNPDFARSLLDQLDADEFIHEILYAAAMPAQIIYLILVAVLSSRKRAKIGVLVASRFFKNELNLSMKLMQILVELGEQMVLPQNFTELVLDNRTRRSALNLAIAFLKSDLDISEINFSELFSLFEEDLPVNVKRQLAVLFMFSSGYDISFIQTGDAITTSAGFHVSPPNMNKSLKIALNQKEAICAQGAALEKFVEFCQSNEIQNISLAELFFERTGENMVTLQLLRLLGIPSVRRMIPNFMVFVFLLGFIFIFS